MFSKALKDIAKKNNLEELSAKTGIELIRLKELFERYETPDFSEIYNLSLTLKVNPNIFFQTFAIKNETPNDSDCLIYNIHQTPKKYEEELDGKTTGNRFQDFTNSHAS